MRLPFPAEVASIGAYVISAGAPPVPWILAGPCGVGCIPATFELCSVVIRTAGTFPRFSDAAAL